MTAGHQINTAAAIIDTAVNVLTEASILAPDVPRFHPKLFYAAQKRIEPNFTVPQTTISPVMRRFLFQIGYAARARHIYVAGSYVGFAFAWLVMGRAALNSEFKARGVDIDRKATAIAKSNYTHLDCSADVELDVADALQDLPTDRPPIDLLFIDVDCPARRKVAYKDILMRALPCLAPGALVLAHDPLVPVFAEDFRRYFEWIDASPAFGPTRILPLDTCGIGVSVVR